MEKSESEKVSFPKVLSLLFSAYFLPPALEYKIHEGKGIYLFTAMLLTLEIEPGT